MPDQNSTEGHGFLAEPAVTPEVRALYDDDVADDGYVMNLTRLWAHVPSAKPKLFALLADAVAAGRLTFRQRGILVTAAAAANQDSYCSLAWGTRLARSAGADSAAAVVREADDALDPADRALARWARRVAKDPNDTTADDVQALRDVGFDDDQIFAITVFIALRQAFSTVNDALGALPDRQLLDAAPTALVDVVGFGRTASGAPSTSA